MPDPVDDVIAIAGADFPPEPPIGRPRDWVEWEDATEAGRPSEEGANKGTSRDFGDRVDRDDLRYLFALSEGAIGTGRGAVSATEAAAAVSTCEVVGGPADGGGIETFSSLGRTGITVSARLSRGSTAMRSVMPEADVGSDTCSMTEGMMGGKYPSFLWIARLGDVVIGAVSRRLVGRPLISPLVRVLNGGRTGRADDPITEVGEVS